MLIRKLESGSRFAGGVGPIFLVVGQACIVAAIMLGRSASEAAAIAVPFEVSTGDFWQGFLAGLGGTLVGVSVPLNLAALRRWRSAR